MGRDFLVNSAITTASDISMAGTKAAQSRYLIIDKTDSLILFRDPKYNVRLNEQDDNQDLFPKQFFRLPCPSGRILIMLFSYQNL